jgi:SagB-type dehydrogenase family enzyme
MRSKQTDVARLFHVHTRHERSRTSEMWPDKDLKLRRFRTYPGSKRTPLPGRDFVIDAPLGAVLERRRSVRDYVLRPLPLATLGRLLHACHGIKGERPGDDAGERTYERSAPSAGGLYPLEIYVATQSVEGLEDGIYHYDVHAHELELRSPGVAQPRLAGVALDQTMVLTSNVVAIITAIPERTMWKYGQRGYRYVWLDAGHLGQNLYLVATALGLGPAGIGGFFDRELNELMALPAGEEAFYLVCIGQPEPAKEITP